MTKLLLYSYILHVIYTIEQIQIQIIRNKQRLNYFIAGIRTPHDI